MKGVEGRDVEQSPLQYRRLVGKNVPTKLSNKRKPIRDGVECGNTTFRSSHSRELEEDSNSDDLGHLDGESKVCNVNGTVVFDREVVGMEDTVGVVEATTKFTAAINVGNSAASKRKIPVKGQNRGSSSSINISKCVNNIEAQHIDIVVEVLPCNIAKGNHASKQVAKRTYGSNLNKSCSFITDV